MSCSSLLITLVGHMPTLQAEEPGVAPSGQISLDRARMGARAEWETAFLPIMLSPTTNLTTS